MNCTVEVRGIVPPVPGAHCKDGFVSWHAEFQNAQSDLEDMMQHDKLNMPEDGWHDAGNDCVLKIKRRQFFMNFGLYVVHVKTKCVPQERVEL